MATTKRNAFERMRAALALGLAVHAVALDGEDVYAGPNKTQVPEVGGTPSHRMRHAGTSALADTYYGDAEAVALLFVEHAGSGAAKRAAVSALYREEVRECLFGPRRQS